MEASPTAIALVTVAAIAGLFGFVLSIQTQRRLRDTVTWLKENRRAEWEALPWTTRALHPISAVTRLKRALHNDAEFTMHYAAVTRVRPHMLAALGVSLCAIATALIGSFVGLWTL